MGVMLARSFFNHQAILWTYSTTLFLFTRHGVAVKRDGGERSARFLREGGEEDERPVRVGFDGDRERVVRR
jgi:hypothetical protein